MIDSQFRNANGVTSPAEMPLYSYRCRCNRTVTAIRTIVLDGRPNLIGILFDSRDDVDRVTTVDVP